METARPQANGIVGNVNGDEGEEERTSIELVTNNAPQSDSVRINSK